MRLTEISGLPGNSRHGCTNKTFCQNFVVADIVHLNGEKCNIVLNKNAKNCNIPFIPVSPPLLIIAPDEHLIYTGSVSETTAHWCPKKKSHFPVGHSIP